MSGGAENILLQILLVAVAAKVGGFIAERLKQPAVLGELLVGILLGASLLGKFVGMPDLALSDQARAASAGGNGAFFLAHAESLANVSVLSTLASLGAILLLFEVGLESNLKELTRVGPASLRVAAIGIVVSFVLGYAASHLLASWLAPWQAANAALPPYLLHVFVGATLTATSVGITARVLGDLGKLRTRETRIILGAAVLDDIGGLLILAVVAALVKASTSGETVSTWALLRIAGTAVGFLVLSLAIGLKTVPRGYDFLVARLHVKGFPVVLAFAFALLMAYLASLAGLADIVGAFAGGLLLARTKHQHQIFEDLKPLAAVFVGFFFVTLGMRVDLTRLEGHGWLILAIGLLLGALAVAAKLACGLGVNRQTASRLVVGVGMVPRGEVGLIFAALGLSTGLLANWQYTALLVVVLLTTFVTPIWLQSLRDRFRGEEAGSAETGENLGEVLSS